MPSHLIAVIGELGADAIDSAVLKCSMFKIVENKNMCKRIVCDNMLNRIYKDKLQCLKYLNVISSPPQYVRLPHYEIIPNIPMEHYVPQ